MVCARAMRDLCQTWKSTGRVDHLAAEAMSFDEVKELLGVGEYLGLRAELLKEPASGKKVHKPRSRC